MSRASGSRGQPRPQIEVRSAEKLQKAVKKCVAVMESLASNIDDELCSLAEVAREFGTACHALIVPEREDLRTVGLEMGHRRIHVSSELP